MSGATIVDQLIVKLSLDPSNFTKGQKEAAAAVVNTKESVERANEGIGRSFTGLVGKVIGFTAAIVAIKKVIGYIDDVSERTRRLGINAQNYDISAAKLRNFQNAAEIMGGSAEEITKTIAGLQKSLFDLSYNGQISESLVMLGRLGVQFQDAGGHARNFQDVLLDTADAIEKAQKQGMTRSEAFNYLQEAGFDQGSIQLALLGRAGAQAELNKQAARNQVTDENFKDATTIQRAKIGAGQYIEAEAGLRTLAPAAAVVRAAEDPEKTFESIMAGLSAISSKVADGFEVLANATGKLVDKFKDFAGGGIVGGTRYLRSDFDSAINAAAKKNGIDPTLLSGVINTESNFNPNATSSKGGKVVGQGIAQLNPKYHPEAGQNPINDIYTAAQTLASLKASFMKDGNDEDAAWNLALEAYNGGETRVRNALGGGKPLTAETQQYPGKVHAYQAAHPTPGVQARAGAAGGNTTTVDIGTITVNTQATDANGVAAGLNGALNRKLMASHAETGQQ